MQNLVREVAESWHTRLFRVVGASAPCRGQAIEEPALLANAARFTESTERVFGRNGRADAPPHSAGRAGLFAGERGFTRSPQQSARNQAFVRLAVYNPIHYMELPELFMEFIASLTGKSPSTTGAGSEGALTKGPFNALPPIYDLNSALLVLCAHRLSRVYYFCRLCWPEFSRRSRHQFAGARSVEPDVGR